MMGKGFFARSALGRSLWGFRREVAWVAVFSTFANVLVLTPTLYMLQVYDRVMLSGSELTLLALTAITVLFFLVMGFAEWVRSRLLVRAGARLDVALNTQVFNASFESNLGRPARNPVQSFNDLTTLRQFLTGNGAFAFFDTPWSLLYIAVLFVMHPWLGWAAVGFALLMSAVAFAGHRLMGPRLEAAQEAGVEATAYLHGKMRNAETVEAMGMANDLRRQWLALHRLQISRHEHGQNGSQHVLATTKFLQYSQQSLMLALGALLAIDGKIGVGAMIASNALASNALRPISTLVSTWKMFVEARKSYARLEVLLEENPERIARHESAEVQGQVTVHGLTARAPKREAPILEDLNLEFKAGEVVAIVGPSGAGKSTLARCLVGIWPGVSGQVLLDGHALHEWSREALGPNLGYLPQDTAMLDGTIAENIARFGEVNSAAVIEAASRTGLHEMILRLPKGYDTPMGEAGGLLSGGQRQRVGLARAIYGDPSLVVLDEPNSSLDDAGEAALIRTVRDLRSRGRTVFMIVHQRHLLAVADRALFLENGKVTRLSAIALAPATKQIEAPV